MNIDGDHIDEEGDEDDDELGDCGGCNGADKGLELSELKFSPAIRQNRNCSRGDCGDGGAGFENGEDRRYINNCHHRPGELKLREREIDVTGRLVSPSLTSASSPSSGSENFVDMGQDGSGDGSGGSGKSSMGDASQSRGDSHSVISASERTTPQLRSG